MGTNPEEENKLSNEQMDIKMKAGSSRPQADDPFKNIFKPAEPKSKLPLGERIRSLGNRLLGR